MLAILFFLSFYPIEANSLSPQDDFLIIQRCALEAQVSVVKHEFEKEKLLSEVILAENLKEPQKLNLLACLKRWLPTDIDLLALNDKVLIKRAGEMNKEDSSYVTIESVRQTQTQIEARGQCSNEQQKVTVQFDSSVHDADCKEKKWYLNVKKSREKYSFILVRHRNFINGINQNFRNID